jgi:MFS family permease
MKNKIVAYFAQFEPRFWVLSFGWFASALGFSVSIPFISIYFHSHLGLSIFQIGLFFGALAVVRSVFQIIGGEASDRIDRRFLLIDSQMIRAISFGAMALAVYYHWGFWAVSVSLLINSIFGAIFQPAANAMVADILPREKRLDGYAITRSATNLGWACGPAMGGFLASASYGLLFLISGLITCASGLILWRFLKVPTARSPSARFRLVDLWFVTKDPLLATHSVLILVL